MTKYLLRYLAVLAGVALAAGLLFPGSATAQPDPSGTQARPAAAAVDTPAGASASSGAITSTATAAPNACTRPPGCCPAAQIAPQSAIPQSGPPGCEPPPPPTSCTVTADIPVHVVIRDRSEEHT